MGDNQLIIFRLGEEEFGVEINEVREIITVPDITKIPDVEEYVLGIINLRNKIISVIDLEKKLKLLPDMNTKEKRIIIIEIDGEQIGMLVDSCNQVLHLNNEQIDKAPETIIKKIGADYIKGVGKIQERLIILLDLQKLIGNKMIKEVKKITDNKKNIENIQVDLIEESTKKNTKKAIKKK